MSSPVGPSIQYPESPGVLDTSAVSKVCSGRVSKDGVVGIIGIEGCMYCTRWLPVSCAMRETISEYSPTIHAAALRTYRGRGAQEVGLRKG
jgi:hypothetical protein